MLITIATSFSVVLSFVVASVAEQNPKAWIVKLDMELVCILYAVSLDSRRKCLMQSNNCVELGIYFTGVVIL